MVQEHSLWPGWETVKPIGKGGFGSVYEIRRDLFGSTESAALKVITIPQSEGEIDELRADGHDQASIEHTYTQYMQSIISEYTIMRKLNACPNIVLCDDVRYERHPDGIGWDIFIKMELLTPLLKAFPGQISEQLVLKAGKDLCNALIMCKQFHVLHRDIKPQNIFVSNTGDFKLGDFGIAKAAAHTMGGTKIGTYKYMAPEVYHDQPYGSAADIYSLGLVLYWMLNDHRLPFLPMPPAMPTFSDEEQAKLRRFRGEPIPAPKNGSPALKAVVLKACAFHPADRFTSAAEMLKALEQAGSTPAPAPEAQKKTEETVRARPIPQVNPRPIPQPEPKPAPQPVPQPVPPSQPAKNKKRKLFFTITALLVVAAILLVVFLPPKQQMPSKEEASTNIGAGDKNADTQPDKNSWTDIVDISASEFHAVGLKKDGTVVAVGSDGDVACNVGDWTDIVAISAGTFYTVGLKKDGTVVAVGDNDDGECNVEGWTNIVAISAGCSHTVGLKKDGTVVAVGNNDDGQCNVEDWTDIVAIIASSYHTVGLKGDGTVVAVGANYDGQCNVDGWTNITAISAGWNHTVGLKKDGTVVAVGDNDDGQCNVDGWTDITAISAAMCHTVGLKKDGTVVAVGWNEIGQCDVANWTDIVAISAGSWSTVGLKKDGTVVAAGANYNADAIWTAQNK